MTKRGKKLKITISAVCILLVAACICVLGTISASGLTTTTIEGASYYQISNADDLYEFAQIVNGTHPTIAQNTAANAILTADITVNEDVLTADGALNGDGSNFKVWTPIGHSESEYKGVFDGDGHTISGLYFNDSTVGRVGLFNTVDRGTIKNVGVVDSYLSGGGNMGGLVGYFYDGTLENCYNEGTVIGTGNAGGIVGGLNYRIVKPTVQYCYNMGKVQGNGYVGGIVGLQLAGTVQYCYNHGDIRGGGDSTGAGGIVGTTYTYTVTQYCYSSAKISGWKNVGALIGDKDGGSATNMYFNSDLHTGNPAGSTSSAAVATRLVPIPTEQFFTGEVAYKLGMKQNIDNGEIADQFPNFTGAAVYQLKGCDGELTNRFSNDPDKKVCSGGNYDEKGYCKTTGCEPEAGMLVTEKNYEALGLTKDHIGYYAISHADQLYWLSQMVESTKNYKVKVVLTADIDLNPGYTFSHLSDIGMVKVLQDETAVAYIGTGLEGTTRGAIYTDTNKTLAESQTLSFLRPWTPIGFNNQYYYYQFRGVFDGNCKVVRGMYYNGTANKVGLIGTLYDSSSGLVKNVGVENCCLISSLGSPRIGGVVGNLMYGRVENCYTHTGFIGGNSAYVGGVVGYVGGSSSGIENRVANCYSLITVKQGSTNGGPIGTASKSAIVENCYYYGSELDDIDGTTALSKGDTASIGEMTYRLNRGVTDGTQVFYYPPSEPNTITWTPCFDKVRGETVYLKAPCPSGYTTNPDLINAHNFTSTSNGFCTRCDVGYQEATLVTEENRETLGLAAEYVGYYAIENGGQLFWFAEHINKVDRTASAVLVADIDLENRPWTPIGTTSENTNNFRGVFDGQNHTITGLYVEGGRAGLGFFGEVRTGTVKNFTIYGEVKLNGKYSYVGGVIGSACGLNGENDLERNGATIRNITSYVNLTLGEDSNGVGAHGSSYVGGFIGYTNHETLVENCTWYGTLDLGIYRAQSGVGGLVGAVYNNSSVTIRNCVAYGTIKTAYKSGTYNNQDSIYIGGIVSNSVASSNTIIENTVWAGTVVNDTDLGANAHISAIGTLSGFQSVTNCYALEGSAPYITTNGTHDSYITTVTAEQLASGEVAYRLGAAFGQDIKADEADTEYNAAPVLGGATVYQNQIGGCNEASFVYGYANTQQAPVTSHDMADATCEAPKTCKNGCGHTEGEALDHIDENTDHICDRACGKEDMNMDQHLDGDDNDHLCDYGCGQIADDGCHDVNTDEDQKCDECGTDNVTEHTDGDDADHLCDNGCGEIADDGCHDVNTDEDHKCDECGTDNVTEHTDGDDVDHLCDNGCGEIADDGCHDGNTDTDHKCDECGADGVTEHIDSATAADHKCDECGAKLEDCIPHEDDGDCTTAITCSVCGAVTTEGANVHTGGTATCENKAECTVCGKEYGELSDHTYVDGKCECGATDPNYTPETEPITDPEIDEPEADTSGESASDPTDKPSDKDDGLRAGAIIGIVIGSVAVVGSGGFALFWFVIKKKKWSDLVKIFKK